MAKEKNYSDMNWFFVGFFCGLFGLITAIGLPNKSNQLIDYSREQKNLMLEILEEIKDLHSRLHPKSDQVENLESEKVENLESDTEKKGDISEISKYLKSKI